MPEIVTHSAAKARRLWWVPLFSLAVLLLGAAAVDLSGDATPSSAGEGDLFSNVNCDEAVDTVDSLFELRTVAGLPVSQQEPCPDITSTVLLNGVLYQFGDTDCDGDVDSVDALIILRWIAGLLGTPNPRAEVGAAGAPTCPLPGDPVDIEEKTQGTPTAVPTPTPVPFSADFKIEAVDFQILPFRVGSSGVQSQFFLDQRIPALAKIDFHNNGPDVADFFLELFYDDEENDFDLDFIPEGDDICTNYDGDVIPCDSALVEGLIIFLEDVPVSTTFNVVRELDVICRETGEYMFDIEARARPITQSSDPNLDNNAGDYDVDSGDFPTCVK